MSSLIQIDKDVRELMEVVAENDGEVTPLIEEKLAHLMLSEKAKITSYCNYLDAMEFEIQYVEEKIKEAKAYKERLQKRIENLLVYARFVMEKRGDNKLEGVLGKKLTMREYESVQIDCEPEDLPFEYVTEKTTYTPSKENIKSALKNGEEIPGCKLVKNNRVTWK